VLALERHPVLDRDAAAERAHALEVARRDRLGVVEEPAQPGQRRLAVYVLEDVEHARDRLVVSRVDADRPLALR
jgi:hypothetical protein